MSDDGFGLGAFGDVRRAAAGSFLMERILATGSLVMRRLGVDRAGEMSLHRFLSSPGVGLTEIVETAAARTAEACRGRRIVAVQDTTEVGFSGRDRSRRGLGPDANGAAGFFLHPVVAVDAGDEALLGVLDVQIWTRGSEPTPEHHGRPFAAKESHRWLKGAAAAAERLAQEASVVIVADREGDIYPLFARRPAGVELLVRAAHDRALERNGPLFAAPGAWPELGRLTVAVASRGPGDPGRTAVIALRAGTVVLKRPSKGYDPADPRSVSLSLVEAREVVPDGAAAPRGGLLHWRLLTTLPADGLEAAAEAVRLYRLRWRIEQVFRSLKSDGLRLEDTQVQEADRLFKLAVIGLIAAARTQQLVDARDGGRRPAEDVLDPALFPVADAINRSREGATGRQKNPHPPGSLAWLAWIVARLGGWNCYGKPPGPKTIRTGWTQFAAMAAGFSIAKSLP